jgi:hypothetical protein
MNDTVKLYRNERRKIQMKTKMKKTIISMAASAIAISALTVSAVTPIEAKKAKRKKPSVVLVSRSMTTGQSFNISLKKGKNAKSSNKRVATIAPKYIKKGKKKKKVKYKWIVKAKTPGNARISLKKGKKTYVWSILVKAPARPASRPVQKVMPSKPTPSTKNAETPKPSENKNNQPQTNEAENQKPQTMSEAEKQKRLSELKAELEKKQVLLENAKSSQTGSKKTLENATAQYAQAKKAYDEAQEVVKQGSLGFFRSINAQGAIQLLTRDNIEETSNENVNSFTHMGADGDATSLEGMKDSLDAFKEYEELVKREGLALPKVSTILTAIEQLNCNFFCNNINYESTHESPHTTWGNRYGKSSENLAIVEGSPFKAWYDDEKKTYEEHKDEFSKNPAEAGRKYRVGHYFSIKKGSAADRYMGIGCCYEAYALGYSLTPCHVSTTVEREDIEKTLNSLHITPDELDAHHNDYITEDVDVEEIGDCKYKVTQTTRTAEDLTMSLSEYREKFMTYYDRYVTAPTKERDEKKAVMDSADKKVKEADREITGIENDISAIRTAITSLEK